MTMKTLKFKTKLKSLLQIDDVAAAAFQLLAIRLTSLSFIFLKSDHKCP